MNEDAQNAFIEALLDADKPVPPGLTHPHGGDAADRMAIYRNNVAFSLITVIGAAFPLLANLLGRAAFVALAQAYIRAHPPRDPRMFRDGENLPDFLTHYEGAAQIPYAADVARLEVALQQVANAADAEGLAPAALSDGSIETERLAFVPALKLLRSDWPLAALYHYANGAAPPPSDMGKAQSVLVYRDADYQSHCRALPQGGDTLMRGLLEGLSLVAAAEAADGLEEAGMVEVFSLLVQNNLIAARHKATLPAQT